MVEKDGGPLARERRRGELIDALDPLYQTIMNLEDRVNRLQDQINGMRGKLESSNLSFWDRDDILKKIEPLYLQKQTLEEELARHRARRDKMQEELKALTKNI